MDRRLSLPLVFILACGIAVLAGCHAPIEPTSPTLARVSIESPEQFEALWKATDKALRRYDLEPDRQDRTEGVIETHPQTSAAWFEFWRPQPMPAYAWWEANLHTMRRQATVTIQPTAKPEYQVTVEVDRYRFSLEERQVDNPAAVQRLYGGLAPTVSTGRSEKQAESSRWIPRGRDGYLEQAILSDIIKCYGSGECIPFDEIPATQPTASAG
jgi:hypothetical protein